MAGTVEAEFLEEAVADVLPGLQWGKAWTSENQDRYFVNTLEDHPQQGISGLVIDQEENKSSDTRAVSIYINSHEAFSKTTVFKKVDAVTDRRDKPIFWVQTGPEERKLTVQQPGGEIKTASVTNQSSVSQLLEYMELLGAIAVQDGFITDFNPMPMITGSYAGLEEEMAKKDSCVRREKGCIDPDENHGGSLLNSVVKLEKGLHDSVVVGGREVFVTDILGGYQGAVRLGATIPYLNYDDLPSGYVGGPKDIYQFLKAAMVLMPVQEWDQPWTNSQGESVSVKNIAEGLADFYLHHWGLHGGDHSLYHPEVLLHYYDKKGLDPSPIKKVFLERELHQIPSDLYEGDVGHFTETLGVLLSRENISWSPEELEVARTWVNEVRQFLVDKDLLKLNIDDIYESAHLLRGLRLIAKHQDKLGL